MLLRLRSLPSLCLVTIEAHYLMAIVFDQVVIRKVRLRLTDEILCGAVTLHLKLEVVLLRGYPLLGCGLLVLELGVHLVMVWEKSLWAKEELMRGTKRMIHLLVLLHSSWVLLP